MSYKKHPIYVSLKNSIYDFLVDNKEMIEDDENRYSISNLALRLDLHSFQVNSICKELEKEGKIELYKKGISLRIKVKKESR